MSWPKPVAIGEQAKLRPEGGGNPVNKELIDKLLEVSRQAAREVEAAVSGIKDPHLRGVIGGVIMQRILEEVGDNERPPFPSCRPTARVILERRSGRAAPRRASWTCARTASFANRDGWRKS